MNRTFKTVLCAGCLCLLAGMITITGIGCAGTESRQSTGEHIDDAAITAKVKGKMAKDPVVKAMQIDVETFKGVVQLSGFVDNPEQAKRAVALAKQVNGVSKVKNSLIVKGTQDDK